MNWFRPATWWRRLLGRRRVSLVCMRLAEMRRVHPRQILRRCHVCGAVVGIYPSGQAILQKFGERVDIVCARCHPPAGFLHLAPGAETERGIPRW